MWPSRRVASAPCLAGSGPVACPLGWPLVSPVGDPVVSCGPACDCLCRPCGGSCAALCPVLWPPVVSCGRPVLRPVVSCGRSCATSCGVLWSLLCPLKVAPVVPCVATDPVAGLWTALISPVGRPVLFLGHGASLPVKVPCGGILWAVCGCGVHRPSCGVSCGRFRWSCGGLVEVFRVLGYLVGWRRG